MPANYSFYPFEFEISVNLFPRWEAVHRHASWFFKVEKDGVVFEGAVLKNIDAIRVFEIASEGEEKMAIKRFDEFAELAIY